MNMRISLKLLALTCLLSLCFALPGHAAPRTVKVVFMQTLDDQMGVLSKSAKQYIEEKTKGKYKLELFDSGKMGSEEAMFSSLKLGVTHIALFSAPGYAHPIMNLTAAPFSVRDKAHFDKIYEGEVGKQINEVFAKATGVEPIAHFYRIHQLIFTTKPLINPEDWPKFKIRTATAPAWTTQVNAIGGSVVPLPFSEVYMALQTGVLDGVQTVLDWFVPFKLYEVCKYAIDIKHDFSPLSIFINQKFLRGLPPEDQKIFVEAFTRQKAENDKWVDANVKRYQQALVDNGVKVHTASDADIALYRKQTEDYIRKNAALFGGVELYEKMIAVK